MKYCYKLTIVLTTILMSAFLLLSVFSSQVTAQSQEQKKVVNTNTVIPNNWDNETDAFYQSLNEDAKFYSNFAEAGEGWVIHDNDGDLEEWVFTTQIGEENPLFAYDGANFAASFSWSGAPLSPDNWLITPQISVDNGDELSFYVNSNDGWPAERLTVYVSTTGTEVEDFTEEIFNKVLGVGDWRSHAADLSQFDGQDVYIAFRHWDTTDENYLALDAVQVTSTPTSVGPEPEIAQSIQLNQNYPNPFNPTTEISFTVPEASDVALTVYNVKGQQVATLANQRVSAGSHSFTFNAENLSSGLYFYRLTTGNITLTEKMTLIK